MNVIATRLFLAALSAACVVAQPVLAAKQRFVNDQCPPMRRGADETFKIIRFLPGGSPVEILQTGENGWNMVRAAGADGWVQERYLTDEAPPRQQLEAEKLARSQAEESLALLKTENQTLKEQLANLDKTSAELQHIKQISGNAIAMEKEIEALKHTLTQVRQELEQVSDEKKAIEMSADVRFFLTGAGVLILGFVGGASLNGKRRRTDML